MGLFDALFSGGKDYGSAGDLSAGRNGLGQQNGIAAQYGGLGQDALSQYGSDNGTYRNALTGYENYLSKDPASDNFVAGQEANATSGTLAAYTRARANLAASAQSRGAGGGQSSLATGGQAGLDAAAAGSLAQAGTAASQFNINNRNQNMATLANLTGGVANQDYGRGMNALNDQEGILSHTSGAYLGLGQDEQQNEISSQNAANQGLLGLASGAASIYGSGLLGGGGRAKTPTYGGLGTFGEDSPYL